MMKFPYGSPGGWMFVIKQPQSLAHSEAEELFSWSVVPLGV